MNVEIFSLTRKARYVQIGDSTIHGDKIVDSENSDRLTLKILPDIWKEFLVT